MKTSKFPTKAFLFSVLLIFLLGCAGTRPPKWINNYLKPDYPEAALEKGIEGKVALFLFLDNQGSVTNVRVRKSSGSKILDDAAVEYGKELHFTPAKKSGKPIPIVLTWEVTFDARNVFFQPKEYAAVIKDWYQRAGQLQGKDKHLLLEKILEKHAEYVKYSKDHPLLNYNKFIKSFLLPDVAEQWKPFFENWPLRFIVYQDFAARFPQSDLAPKATEKMIELLKYDISQINLLAESIEVIDENKDLYLQTIYSFLAQNYPASITPGMQPEADKYLKK